MIAAGPTRGADADSPPWLRITASARPVVVDRAAERDEPLVSLEIVSRVDRAVRVASVEIVYLGGESVLATRRPGAAFFAGGRLARSDRIDGGSRETWTGICLEGMPREADGVRFDLALVLRRGLRSFQSVQSVLVTVADAPPPVPLRLPFRGHWTVSQGHDCGTNHRLGARGGEFAWDFVFVDRDDAGRRAPELASFGREVLAPVAGRVVKVVADVEDNRARTGYPRRSVLEDLERPDWVYGNYVVIESAGRYVLLAHLERGSPSVAAGDAVEPGQAIARAGNSGNSSGSHLHVHVMDRPDPGDREVRGIPARLVDYVEIRAAGVGESRELFVRRTAAGDPPAGSVVAPDLERRGGRRLAP